jgi:hypothetical protein
MPQKLTPEIIQAAIAGFEMHKSQIDARISELRSVLGGERTGAAEKSEVKKPRKKRSLAVRRKMAAAQRARFAKLKQASEPAEAKVAKPKKRKLSAAGRKNIVEATKRRWAAVKAAKAAKEAETPTPAKKAGRKTAA